MKKEAELQEGTNGTIGTKESPEWEKRRRSPHRRHSELDSGSRDFATWDIEDEKMDSRSGSGMTGIGEGTREL